MKIGIGVTSKYFPADGLPNRYKQTSAEGTIIKYNTDQTTISRDKNKLIKQLYDDGCDCLFIFDDDTFPIHEGWEQFFINAAIKNEVDHFVLCNKEHHGDCIKLCADLVGYETGTGCMLFLTRRVIEKVGYMNTAYGKYGYEHAAYSHRIHRAGLTPAWYVSVDGWEEYIFAYDLQKEQAELHGFVKETAMTEDQRSQYIKENEVIFNQEIGTDKIYYPYDQSVPKRMYAEKPRVLFFAPDKVDNTSYYRCHGVLPYLDQSEFDLIDVSDVVPFSWATFINCAVLIFQRPCLEWHTDTIQLAKSAGVRVISDFDDNLLAVDWTNPTADFYQQQKRVIMQCIHLSDEVWVTTGAIKEAYSKLNKAITVIPNAHNDYQYPVAMKKPFNKNTKHILYRGGKSHQGDIDDVKEELVSLINEYQNWQFNFWGDLYLHIAKRTGDNCFMIKNYMETTLYFQKILQYNANIVIYPLTDNKFNHAKSNVCWLEATFGGAAFFGMGEWDEWNVPGIADYAHLEEELINPDFDVLKEANECSWQYICDNLLLSKVNLLREKSILSWI